MPRSKETYKQLQEVSRHKILMAAFELFASRSYATTTVDSIAQKAKVSKGLIYRYFDSKQDLLKGIFHLITQTQNNTCILPMPYHQRILQVDH